MDYKDDAIQAHAWMISAADASEGERSVAALQSIAASLIHLTAILTPKPEHPRICPLCHGTGLQETEVGRVPCRCPLGANYQ
jgi:hypothetical protein